MQVLFVAKHYLPHIGGVEVHIKNITEKLKAKNFKVTVVCEQIKGTPKHETIDGAEVYRIKYPHTKILGLLTIWWWFWKHRSLVAQSNIVHCHDVFIWYLPFSFIFFNKPVYSTFHGWEGIFPIPFKNKLIRQICHQLSWGNIVVGRYIEKWYGIRANYVTYGGVDKFSILNFKFSMKSKNNNIKILYFGRLDQDTGIKTYLEAFRMVKQKYPKVVFEFLGDGEFRNLAEKFGKVHGFKKNVIQHIASAQFICTSGYLSMIEAMAYQKLVFAVSENKIKADILKMSPFENYVIHEKDPKTLTRKMGYFLTNPQKANTIKLKSSAWAALQTWDRVAQLYLALWKKT